MQVRVISGAIYPEDYEKSLECRVNKEIQILEEDNFKVKDIKMDIAQSSQFPFSLYGVSMIIFDSALEN